MKKSRNNSGYVLVVVLVTISMVMILCATVATLLTNESYMAASRSDSVDASYAAQAGFDHLSALMMKSYTQNISPQTVILKDDGSEKVYYNISRLSYTSAVVYSVGCVERNGELKKSVTITGTIDQMGNVVIEHTG